MGLAEAEGGFVAGATVAGEVAEGAVPQVVFGVVLAGSADAEADVAGEAGEGALFAGGDFVGLDAVALDDDVFVYPGEEGVEVVGGGGEVVPDGGVALEEVARPGEGEVVAFATEGGGAGEVEMDLGGAGFAEFPEVGVGAGRVLVLDCGEGEGVMAEGEVFGGVAMPLAEPVAGTGVEGAEGEGVGVVGLEGGVLKAAEAEGFGGAAVVEFAGEVRVGLADLVEEPGVDAFAVVRVEGDWGLGLEMELEADEGGAGGPGC